MSVAKKLSSVHRTLIDALRTTLVWSVDVFIFYLIPGGKRYGEELTWPWSAVQAVGFIVLICGTLIYNKIIKLPAWFYSADDEIIKVDLSDTTGNGEIHEPTNESMGSVIEEFQKRDQNDSITIANGQPFVSNYS